MIDKLLNTALGPLKVKAWGAILLALAMLAWVVVQIADNAVEDTLDTAKEAGAAKAESAGKSTTLKQNKDAKDAEDEIRRGGDAAVDGCLSDARGDARGCGRFRN